ncbi:hypothetical protein TA3x_003472 [Tundrisphaera sp. TA3]|uniref:hypothetical protein n=1 Tax=Tundrisphaera sp. TA3 TaxID=3435775 RepID=UPI003EBED61C
MTIREFMNRKKKRVALIALACSGCFAISALLTTKLGVLAPIVILPILGGVFVCLIYAQHFAFRCPNCQGPWDAFIWKTGFLIAIDRRLRYCPYCATDIDAKGGATPKPVEADFFG